MLKSNSLLLLVLLAWYFTQGPGKGSINILTPNKVENVAYVYERDDNPIPDGVEAAFQEINQDPELGIVAVPLEADGTVTPRWAPAYDAAKEFGLPCLVLLPEGKCVKASTFDEVMEAIK